MKAAAKLLKEAIELHEGHMDGSIPTDQKSQQKLMDLIVEAHEQLTMSATDKARGAFDMRVDAEKRSRKA